MKLGEWFSNVVTDNDKDKLRYTLKATMNDGTQRHVVINGAGWLTKHALDHFYNEDVSRQEAEDKIGNILNAPWKEPERKSVLKTIQEECCNENRPAHAAFIFRTIAPLNFPCDKAWRTSLVKDGLKAKDPEIRDAAAGAAEHWIEKDKELIDILAAHQEPLPWLRDYIRDVVEDQHPEK